MKYFFLSFIVIICALLSSIAHSSPFIPSGERHWTTYDVDDWFELYYEPGTIPNECDGSTQCSGSGYALPEAALNSTIIALKQSIYTRPDASILFPVDNLPPGSDFQKAIFFKGIAQELVTDFASSTSKPSIQVSTRPDVYNLVGKPWQASLDPRYNASARGCPHGTISHYHRVESESVDCTGYECADEECGLPAVGLCHNGSRDGMWCPCYNQSTGQLDPDGTCVDALDSYCPGGGSCWVTEYDTDWIATQSTSVVDAALDDYTQIYASGRVDAWCGIMSPVSQADCDANDPSLGNLLDTLNTNLKPIPYIYTNVYRWDFGASSTYNGRGFTDETVPIYYATGGTASGGSGGNGTITCCTTGSPAWAENVWQGGKVYIRFNSNNRNWEVKNILSNTSNTITIDGTWDIVPTNGTIIGVNAITSSIQTRAYVSAFLNNLDNSDYQKFAAAIPFAMAYDLGIPASWPVVMDLKSKFDIWTVAPEDNETYHAPCRNSDDLYFGENIFRLPTPSFGEGECEVENSHSGTIPAPLLGFGEYETAFCATMLNILNQANTAGGFFTNATGSITTPLGSNAFGPRTINLGKFQGICSAVRQHPKYIGAAYNIISPLVSFPFVGFQQCGNGLDDDLDGNVDLNDAGCTSTSDNTESSDPTPLAACVNGLDDDGDGSTDFPSDTGCSSSADTSELDPSIECDDGLDNEIPPDGNIDYPDDLDCDNIQDDDESTPVPAVACNDGADNDGDGFIDYPADIGCDSALDISESNTTACSDGIDNDGDGWIDYTTDSFKDPGCVDAADTTETNASVECDDGIDNDTDTVPGVVGDQNYIDLADPGCSSSTDTSESGFGTKISRAITEWGRNINYIYDLATNNAAFTFLATQLPFGFYENGGGIYNGSRTIEDMWEDVGITSVNQPPYFVYDTGHFVCKYTNCGNSGPLTDLSAVDEDVFLHYQEDTTVYNVYDSGDPDNIPDIFEDIIVTGCAPPAPKTESCRVIITGYRQGIYYVFNQNASEFRDYYKTRLTEKITRGGYGDNLRLKGVFQDWQGEDWSNNMDGNSQTTVKVGGHIRSDEFPNSPRIGECQPGYEATCLGRAEPSGSGTAAQITDYELWHDSWVANNIAFKEHMAKMGAWLMINCAGWSDLPHCRERIDAASGSHPEQIPDGNLSRDQWLVMVDQIRDVVTDPHGTFDWFGNGGLEEHPAGAAANPHHYLTGAGRVAMTRYTGWLAARETSGYPGQSFFDINATVENFDACTSGALTGAPCLTWQTSFYDGFVDLGWATTSDPTVLATGSVPVGECTSGGVNYYIYERTYPNNIRVIFRARDHWSCGVDLDDYGATSAVTVSLGGTYKVLREDGTYGPYITDLTLYQAEGVILYPVIECNDGLDNDGDGKTDYSATPGIGDPGCSSLSDTSEKGTLLCDDGINNDYDAVIDYPADVGCTGPDDDSEFNTDIQCDDGIDNNTNGQFDLNDSNCSSNVDPSEYVPTECNDGLNNDYDSLIDLADPGCVDVADTQEINASIQCDDGLDNDSDGVRDRFDTDCSSSTDPLEGPSGPAVITADFEASPVQGATCIAPCLVHMNAIASGFATSSTGTTESFRDLTYEWDCGDPSAGVWETTGKPINNPKGAITGCLYNFPGTYNPTLTVTDKDGNISQKTRSITISDPLTTLGAANIICYRANSTGNFYGCPLDTDSDGDCDETVPGNCRTIGTSPATLTAALNGATECNVDNTTTAKGCYFRRGDTFTGLTAAMTLSGSVPSGPSGMVGAFGVGARPVFANSNYFLENNSRWTTHDIDIQFNQGGFSGYGVNVDNFTSIRMRGRELGRNIATNCGNADTGGGTKFNTLIGYAGFDCSFFFNTTPIVPSATCIPNGTDPYCWSGQAILARAEKLLLLGSRIDNNYQGEFNFRSVGLDSSSLQNNIFMRPGDEGISPGGKGLRNNIQLRAWANPSATPVAARTLDHIVVSDNILIGTNSTGAASASLWIRSCQHNQCTITPGSSTIDARNVIIERNFFTFDTNSYSALAGQAIWIEGNKYTVRNNIFDMQGLSNGPITLFNQAQGACASCSDNDNVVVNNTIYTTLSSAAAANDNITLCVGTTGSINNLCQGNLVWRANAFGSGTQLSTSGGTWTSTDNLFATANPFTAAPPAQGSTSATDFQLAASAAAALDEITPAEATVPNPTDFELNKRPFNTNSDIGAWEYGASTYPTFTSQMVGINSEKLEEDEEAIYFANLFTNSVQIRGSAAPASGTYETFWQSFLASDGTTPSADIIPTNNKGYPSVAIPYDPPGPGAPIIARAQISKILNAPRGTYQLYFTGATDIRLSGDATAVTCTTSPCNVTINPTTAGINLYIYAMSDPASFSLCLLIPGETDCNAYYSKMLDKLRPFAFVRGLNFMQVNHYPCSNLNLYEHDTLPAANQCNNNIDDDGDGFTDYDGNGTPALTDPSCVSATDTSEDTPNTERSVCQHTWAGRVESTGIQSGRRGLSWEHQIGIANAAGVDLWITIPHAATNDYITQLATLIHNTLDPSLKVYIEFTNEAWNGAFGQYDYLAASGALNGWGAGTTAERRMYINRTVAMIDIFDSVFAGELTRVVRVLGSQYASPGVTTSLLTTFPLAPYNPTGATLDAVAIAPYFGNTTGASYATADAFLDAMVTQIDGMTSNLNLHYGYINAQGLDMLAYEGGPDFSLAGTLYVEAANSPRMIDLTAQLYDEWFAAGGQQAALGFLVRDFQNWGALRWLDQPLDKAPKYKGHLEEINRFNTTVAP